MENNKKTLGGILLVAGTSIGAAMLALPIAAAEIGLWSFLYLIVVALVMVYAANLLGEIYKIKNKTIALDIMAKETLGKFYGFITKASLFMLLYALIVAYLSALTTSLLDATPMKETSSVLFLTLFLVVSFTISDFLIDIYNRVSFIIKMITLVTLAIFLCDGVAINNLFSESPSNPLAFITILPVLLTSFGFHGSIAFIYNYLGNFDSYKKAVESGTLITFLLYCGWILIIFALVSKTNLIATGGQISHLITLLTNENSFLSRPIKAFCNLAIITSLLGVALGLFNLLADHFKNLSRFQVSCMVFLIPAGILLWDASLFLQALKCASVALTVIAIIIPGLLSLQMKIGKKSYIYLTFVFAFFTILGEVISLISR
jgi:tyrosine-specific transport protein